MGGISVWQLLIIAVIVVLLFGTKKLRGIGGDLGSAVKGFKKAMSDEDSAKNEKDADFVQLTETTIIGQPHTAVIGSFRNDGYKDTSRQNGQHDQGPKQTLIPKGRPAGSI